MQLDNSQIDKFIHIFLNEDIGRGDITSISTIDEHAETEFFIRSREKMISCGANIAKRVFEIVSPDIKIDIKHQEGTRIKAGDIILTGQGNARAILAAERVALNLLRQTCGVATYVSKFVELTNGTKAKILDSRKTIPGLRIMQKYAVKIGGGHNHRFGLDDGILIKDNHISVCGGVQEALKKARQNAPALIKIEIECDTLEQVEQAVKGGADIIMLDNMDIETTKQAVKIVAGRVVLEASGNVNLARVSEIAQTGVDYISVGAVTSSPISVDIGLDMDL